MTLTNTIGTVRLACCNCATAAVVLARMTSGAERHQFRRVIAIAAGIGGGPARIDPHVAAVRPAQLLAVPAAKPRRGPAPSDRAARFNQHPNAPHPLALLRARRERPRRRRAAEQRDELARASFDHLVGAQQECLWDREAERLDGCQIDDKLELGRLLDRKVSGFSPFENFVDKVGRMSELIRVI